MGTSNLREIARKMLNKEGRLIIEKLLREGRIEEAKESLLVVIDCGWVENDLTFDEAAELYNRLDLSPERASMFRQRHVGDIYQ